MSRDLLIAQYPVRCNVPNRHVVEGSFTVDAGPDIDPASVLPRSTQTPDSDGYFRSSGFKIKRQAAGQYRVKVFPYIKCVKAFAKLMGDAASEVEVGGVTLKLLCDTVNYDPTTPEPFIDIRLVASDGTPALVELPVGTYIAFEFVFQTIEQ